MVQEQELQRRRILVSTNTVSSAPSNYYRTLHQREFSSYYLLRTPLGQVGCGGNGDRINRHHALRDALFSAAQSAALASQRGPLFDPQAPGRVQRISFSLTDVGDPAAMDVTVISTMQPLTQTGEASDRGYGLKVGEGRKMTAHNADCQAAGVAFVPLVVETLGGWSQEAVLHISKIGRLVGQRLGTNAAEAVRHLFQTLSGEETPPCGLAAFHSTLPGWTVTSLHT